MDQHIDWTLAQSFLAVAEAGSLSAAARAMGMSQPSLGRHIAKIERQLNVRLFSRAPRGLALTQAGHSLLPHARAMQQAARGLALAAAAREEGMAGPVRITASRIMAHFTLPALLADLRRKAPQIEIDLIASDASENLLFREADIALRMYRPRQLDLVAKHIRDIPIALYAAPALLAQCAPLTTKADLLAMPMVGFDTSDLILRVMQRLGHPRTRADFPLRCDDQLVYWQLVRAGAGIGAMQREIGDADASVIRLPDLVTLPPLPLWMAVPSGLLAAPRIRFVFDHLAAGLAKPAAKPAANSGSG